MNKLIALVLSVFLCINSSFALSNEDIPDEFSITEHWISLTTSFDIETKTEKLGTLYRKFFSLLLTYELFDPLNHKLATAKSKFFSLTAHFDVYDNNNILIGIAEERLFAFFPTFDIYAKNATTKLARAKMNFWGTTFTIYDTVTDKEIATMHRSFFRFKNDWDFKITNKELFSQRSIDPRVLMTVIAFQGDREYWERDRNNNSSTASNTVINSSTALTQQLNVLLKKIDVISKQEQLRTINNADPKTLETIASELENNYKNMHLGDNSKQTNQEQITAFTDYCFSLVQSNDVSDTKKATILFLLKMRLEGGAI